MDRYKIYCTKAQTKSGLELGAPITWCEKERKVNDPTLHEKGKCYKYFIPTAEQMIGWLEEKDIIYEIEVSKYEDGIWTYMVHLKNKPAIVNHTPYNSRKESTIAAINAALEYLSNNKE